MARTDENLGRYARKLSNPFGKYNYLQKYEGFDPTSSKSYIIFEFMQNKHMEQSISLASEVQKCFASAKRNNRRGRRVSLCYKTSMPSIRGIRVYLESCGRTLHENEGRANKLATAIYNAFTKYKWEYDRKRGALAEMQVLLLY